MEIKIIYKYNKKLSNDRRTYKIATHTEKVRKIIKMLG